MKVDFDEFRLAIFRELHHRLSGTVDYGPFTGMLLSPRVFWGDGDMAAKLLGFYEQELHPYLERVIDAQPAHVLNIGAAEGYYAVGLKRRLPGAVVHAFERDSCGLDVLGENARLNGVDIWIRGECTVGALKTLLDREGAAFIFSDCEGAETTLFDLHAIPALADCPFLIESHSREATLSLMNRFLDTHHLTLIGEGERNPSRTLWLASLPSRCRWLAIDEGRPCGMQWLFGVPTGQPAASLSSSTDTTATAADHADSASPDLADELTDL